MVDIVRPRTFEELKAYGFGAPLPESPQLVAEHGRLCASPKPLKVIRWAKTVIVSRRISVSPIRASVVKTSAPAIRNVHTAISQPELSWACLRPWCRTVTRLPTVALLRRPHSTEGHVRSGDWLRRQLLRSKSVQQGRAA